MNAQALCALHVATGSREDCPGNTCAFWEEGGAVVDSGCAFERVRFELDGRPDVARWLLKLRYELENAQSAEEARRIRTDLSGVLPPGLHE